jgi:hypothetical protein
MVDAAGKIINVPPVGIYIGNRTVDNKFSADIYCLRFGSVNIQLFINEAPARKTPVS